MWRSEEEEHRVATECTAAATAGDAPRAASQGRMRTRTTRLRHGCIMVVTNHGCVATSVRTGAGLATDAHVAWQQRHTSPRANMQSLSVL